MDRPTVYAVMPHYGTPHAEAARAFYAGTGSAFRVIHDDMGLSALPSCFNQLWCRALNRWDRGEVSHFAMLHADVIPEAGWLDKLHAEMVTHGADVVSAVVAIKDDRGLTSTAIDDPADPWQAERRLTLKEVLQLPPTFGAADCGYPERALLINTGCWLAKLGPWANGCHFEFRDRIVRNRDGERIAQFLPEDWLFARMAHRAGAKVLATRALKVQHAGTIRFDNQKVWSTAWEIDRAYTDGPLPAFAKEAAA